MADPNEPTETSGPRPRRDRLRDVGSDPDYRFSLANERTFLAWIRTSLALLAGGVAVAQLAPDLGPKAARLAIGVALVVISGVIAAAAHHRWWTAERAMRRGVTLPPNKLAVLLGYGVAIVALVVLAVLLVTGASS